MISKIKYYQENDEELEKIANAGYKFVTENFNGHTVAEKFFKDVASGHLFDV